MKILQVDTGRELRGGQHQLLLLLRGLAARGHEQVLLAREATRRHWPGFEPTLLNLRREARGVDLIHAHSGRGHTLAAAALAGKPLVVSRRVAFAVKPGVMSRWKYGQGDHYIAISNHVQKGLLEAGIEARKISVVYDGVALPDVQETGARPVGSLVEASAARGDHVLAPQINDPLKGQDLLRAACLEAGVELKFSEDLPGDLPAAAAFVYLSESEGLGSAILLAMARKTPVIASRVGGIPELIEHEVSGLLVENRIEQVTAALRRIMGDRAFARDCAERAYQRVCACFLDDIMVRRTEQVYRSVLEHPPL